MGAFAEACELVGFTAGTVTGIGACDLTSRPHRRYNPLSGEWVLVSPQRAQRPWLGQRETAHSKGGPRYDPSCYLCPGNARAGGVRNPAYTGPFVFDNDFPALVPVAPAAETQRHALLRASGERGTCRVVCYSPRHDLTVAEMDVKAIAGVVETWSEQVRELGRAYRWVQVFENKGPLMGCSNPHPHGQIWASAGIPDRAARECEQQRRYEAETGQSMLMAYAELEHALDERTVVVEDDWLALVPYWAIWPFETLVLPRWPVGCLTQLTDPQRRGLARLLKRLLVRYDNLFATPFPYSMGWHGSPCMTGGRSCWQLHAHFYPPLLRSTEVRKFMVGYEMLAEAQRDLTPEEAARRLRVLPEVHYKEGSRSCR